MTQHVDGKITEIRDDGKNGFEIVFYKPNGQDGECRFHLAKEAILDNLGSSFVKTTTPGSDVHLEMTDSDRPRVTSAKINNINVMKPPKF